MNQSTVILHKTQYQNSIHHIQWGLAKFGICLACSLINWHGSIATVTNHGMLWTSMCHHILLHSIYKPIMVVMREITWFSSYSKLLYTCHKLTSHSNNNLLTYIARQLWWLYTYMWLLLLQCKKWHRWVLPRNRPICSNSLRVFLVLQVVLRSIYKHPVAVHASYALIHPSPARPLAVPLCKHAHQCNFDAHIYICACPLALAGPGAARALIRVSSSLIPVPIPDPDPYARFRFLEIYLMPTNQ